MGYSTAKECREQRGVIVKQIHDMVVKAKAEERALSGEEQEAFDRLDKAQEDLRVQADGYERIQKFTDMSLAETRAGVKEQAHRAASHPVVSAREKNLALKGWFLAGTEYETEETRGWAERLGYNVNSPHLHVSLSDRAPRSLAEARALSEGTSPPPGSTTAGGYTVAVDNSLMGRVEEALLAYSNIRPYASVIRTETGANLPIPMTNDTANKGFIVAENALISDVDVSFAQVSLTAWKYSSGIQKVSIELLQDAAFSLTDFIGNALGVRIARVLADHFTTGTGTGQPQGILTGAALGPTSTSTIAAGPSYGDLLALYASVDPAYRDSPNCAFMMHDSTVQKIKALVDTTGRPLWQPALQGFSAGPEDMILGKRVVINQSMPAWGANANAVLFGDLDEFLIRDVKDLYLRRLDERYAEFGMVAWVALSRHDSRLLDAGTHPVKYLRAPATFAAPNPEAKAEKPKAPEAKPKEEAKK